MCASAHKKRFFFFFFVSHTNDRIVLSFVKLVTEKPDFKSLTHTTISLTTNTRNSFLSLKNMIFIFLFQTQKHSFSHGIIIIISTWHRWSCVSIVSCMYVCRSVARTYEQIGLTKARNFFFFVHTIIGDFFLSRKMKISVQLTFNIDLYRCSRFWLVWVRSEEAFKTKNEWWHLGVKWFHWILSRKKKEDKERWILLPSFIVRLLKLQQFIQLWTTIRMHT